MHTVKQCLVFLLVVITLSGCSSGLRQGRKLMPYLSKGTDTIRLSKKTNARILQIHYTGAGGLYVQKDKTALLVDPFFSNPGPLISNIFRRKLPIDSSAIRHYFGRAIGQPKDTQGKIKAVLVSHSHYDHLMDVPLLWHEQLLHRDSVQFIGSKTTGHYLKGAGIPNSSIGVTLKKEATNSRQTGKMYTLDNGSIRIYPIVNAHAPHARILGIPIKFYKGKANKDKFPRRLGGFKEGQTFAFLIDFLNKSRQIDFRLFVQTSSSKPPNGFIPDSLRKQHPIDLAVLGVASFKQVKKYPDALLERMQPRHVLLVHWENFFRSIASLKVKPRAVPKTNVLKFIKKVEEVLPAHGSKKRWTLPLIDTRLVFSF